jgi:hypothetical protein
MYFLENNILKLTGYWGMLRGIKPTELLSGSLGGRLGVVKLKYGKPY